MANIETAQAEAQVIMGKLKQLVPAELAVREEHLFDIFVRHKGNALSKLHDLYDFMTTLYSHVSPVTPCKKGCNSCCHIPVSVSSLELEYMKHRDRKLHRKVGPVDLATSSPCPFLSRGTCTIYEIRPFHCRRHVAITTTSYWCHPDRCHTVKLPQLSFSEVDRVYQDLLHSNGGPYKMFDIREIGEQLARRQ